MKSIYIYQLPDMIQDQIKNELISLNLTTIEDALSSRLCDLEDTININKYIIT